MLTHQSVTPLRLTKANKGINLRISHYVKFDVWRSQLPLYSCKQRALSFAITNHKRRSYESAFSLIDYTYLSFIILIFNRKHDRFALLNKII